MADVQHIYKFAGPPTLAPSGEGHHWVDTVAGTTYISKGVGSVSDWQLMGSGGVPNGGGTGQILQKLSNIDGDAGWVNQPGLNGTANTLARYNASGVLSDITEWSFSSTNKGLNGALLVQPNNLGGNTLNNISTQIQPLQNSPNEVWTIHADNVDVDNLSSGFSFGTSGNGLYLHNNNINHQGTGNMGAAVFYNNSLTFGNGTDPIDIKGIGLSFFFGQISNNTTISGQIQGYGFQLSAQASAVLQQNVTAFYDYANFSCAVPGYTELQATPNISSINNNTNYTGIVLGPTIPTFTGNASLTYLALTGTLGTFGTGNIQSISLNPTVTSVQTFLGLSVFPQITTLTSYAHFIDINPTVTTAPNGSCIGLYINMGNCGGTGHKAIQVVGDVDITGNLSFTGALSIGKLNAFYSQAIVNGGGTPTSIHSLVSSMTVPASTTIALADTIGMNTAGVIITGDNSVVTSAFLGLAALALPAVVQIGASATVDLIEGAVFAISLDGGAGAGGVIDTVALCRSIAVPNGITSINKLHGYDFVLPFGDPGTETWGFYTPVDCYNWFKGSLKIGGTADSTDKVTNSSVAFEIESTTKAFLNARMTTTERDALTALNGMQIYNTTTDRLQVYAAGVWVDLH